MSYDNYFNHYFYDDDYDDEKIEKLYQLRHQINVFGFNAIVKKLRVKRDRLIILYESNIHGSNNVSDLLYINDHDFKNRINILKDEANKLIKSKEFTNIKNNELVQQLKYNRDNFCNIGTNKIKRRLNKISKYDIFAKAIRLLLEIEDTNIQAKKYHGEYSNRNYIKKSKMISELIELFKTNNWKVGYHNSDNNIKFIIFFDLPGCEQISFHNNNKFNIDKYENKWDEKINSTLQKLETVIMNKYPEIIIYKNKKED